MLYGTRGVPDHCTQEEFRFKTTLGCRTTALKKNSVSKRLSSLLYFELSFAQRMIFYLSRDAVHVRVCSSEDICHFCKCSDILLIEKALAASECSRGL